MREPFLGQNKDLVSFLMSSLRNAYTSEFNAEFAIRSNENAVVTGIEKEQSSNVSQIVMLISVP